MRTEAFVNLDGTVYFAPLQLRFPQRPPSPSTSTTKTPAAIHVQKTKEQQNTDTPLHAEPDGLQSDKTTKNEKNTTKNTPKSLDPLLVRPSANMFELRKSFSFEASHRLHHHLGKCAHMHGHSYKLIIELQGDSLHVEGSQTNMLADFQNFSVPVKKLVNTHLDHRHLNDSLDTDSPTAEYIAHWVFHRLQPSIPFLAAVTIAETASCSATYRPTRHCSGCRCHANNHVIHGHHVLSAHTKAAQTDTS